MVLVLSGDDISEVLTMDDTIGAVENAFRDLHSKARLPARTVMEFPEVDGWMAIMPSSLKTLGALGTKVVTVFKNNPQKSKPTTMATMLLNDANTGEPLAIMEAGLITAMRTGGASAIASKYLARKDSSVVGIFGAGMQARFQLLGVSRIRNLRTVKLYAPTRAKSEALAREMARTLGADVGIVNSSKKVVEGSDVIITATTSPTPVFDGRWLEGGTHISAIGAHTKSTRELDTYTMANAKVVVESREVALVEAGEILIPMSEGKMKKDQIYADLSELVAGKKKGRTSNREITVYKGCGIAIEDLATAKLAYDIALKEGLGKNVPL
jgi:alanine dehydrogenase